MVCLKISGERLCLYRFPRGLWHTDHRKSDERKCSVFHRPRERKISKSELYSGVFRYSLIIDGEIVDTKKMVMTE